MAELQITTQPRPSQVWVRRVYRALLLLHTWRENEMTAAGGPQ